METWCHGIDLLIVTANPTGLAKKENEAEMV